MSYKTLEQAENRAEAMIKGIQAALKLAEKLPQCDYVEYYISEGVVSVHLPFDWELYKKYRKLLGKDWKVAKDTWTISQHDDNSIHQHINLVPADSPVTSWLYADAYLKICLDTELEGSACQIEQVGVKETPIYKVKCNE